MKPRRHLNHAFGKMEGEGEDCWLGFGRAAGIRFRFPRKKERKDCFFVIVRDRKMEERIAQSPSELEGKTRRREDIPITLSERLLRLSCCGVGPDFEFNHHRRERKKGWSLRSSYVVRPRKKDGRKDRRVSRPPLIKCAMKEREQPTGRKRRLF